MNSKHTKEIFEKAASHYDADERVLVAHKITEEIRRSIDGLHITTALDYGCGTGLVGLELVDLFDSLLLVDTSPKMIEQVERKIKQGHVDSAQTLCSDFCLEAPSDQQFDLVFMAQVLLHVKEIPVLLERLHAVLNEGGQLIIVDFDKNEKVKSDLVHNGFERDEIFELVKQAGFANPRAHTFYQGKKLFMKEDASLFLLEAKK